MSKGLFITFEGPDGSGKSTQIAFLKTYLEEKGLPCVFTREPGGTAIGEKLRKIILDRNNSEMSDMTEVLLYGASRSQHVDQLIRPALEEGKIVICDRFMDSTMAYQGYGRQLGDRVKAVNDLAVGDCVPDVTFLVLVPPQVGKNRIGKANEDRLEAEKLEFHQRVYQGYRQMAKAEPGRFVEIDGARNRNLIREEIQQHMDRILKNRGL